MKRAGTSTARVAPRENLEERSLGKAQGQYERVGLEMIVSPAGFVVKDGEERMKGKQASI
jgi:hypothetical protein